MHIHITCLLPPSVGTWRSSWEHCLFFRCNYDLVLPDIRCRFRKKQPCQNSASVCFALSTIICVVISRLWRACPRSYPKVSYDWRHQCESILILWWVVLFWSYCTNRIDSSHYSDSESVAECELCRLRTSSSVPTIELAAKTSIWWFRDDVFSVVDGHAVARKMRLCRP